MAAVSRRRTSSSGSITLRSTRRLRPVRASTARPGELAKAAIGEADGRRRPRPDRPAAAAAWPPERGRAAGADPGRRAIANPSLRTAATSVWPWPVGFVLYGETQPWQTRVDSGPCSARGKGRRRGGRSDPRRSGRARRAVPRRRAARPRPRPPRTPARPAPAAPRSARPARRPCRRSPAPAAPQAWIAARPSGAATTVSRALQHDHRTAGALAARARLRRSPVQVEQAGELAVVRRQHAVGPQRRQQRVAGLRRSSSARRRRARSAGRPPAPLAPARASPRPTPAPGPISTAESRASASSRASAAASATGLVITVVRWRGVGRAARPARQAMLTKPAPDAQAPPWPPAAPRRWSATGPPTTSAWPKRYLWLSAVRSGRCAPQPRARSRAGPSSAAATSRPGMPMSARTVSPQRSRPGSSRWPGLRRQKVTVRGRVAARHRASAPVAPSTPGRHVDRDHRRPPAPAAPRPAARATPSSGRARPAPNRASTTSSDAVELRPTPAARRPRPAGPQPRRRRPSAPRGHQGRQPDRPTGAMQQPRHDLAVAAIVARAAQDQHRLQARTAR